MPLKLIVGVGPAALPIVVAAAPAANPVPIDASEIAPAPAALFIASVVTAVFDPIAPDTVIDPAPDESVKVCAPSIVLLKRIVPPPLAIVEFPVKVMGPCKEIAPDIDAVDVVILFAMEIEPTSVTEEDVCWTVRKPNAVAPRAEANVTLPVDPAYKLNP